MHPEAPESSRKAERLRIKPGDSNIKETDALKRVQRVHLTTETEFPVFHNRRIPESAGGPEVF
eukprot:gene18201-21764_t